MKRLFSLFVAVMATMALASGCNPPADSDGGQTTTTTTTGDAADEGAENATGGVGVEVGPDGVKVDVGGEDGVDVDVNREGVDVNVGENAETTGN